MPNRPYFAQVLAIFGPLKPFQTGEKPRNCQIDPILPPHLYGGPLANLASFRLLGAPKGPNQRGHILVKNMFSDSRVQLRGIVPAYYWLFAPKPFDPPNPPKSLQNPNFPENPALPRNPPGIPTEFILSAIQNPTEFHWIPLSFPRNFPNFPEFAQILRNPWNFRFLEAWQTAFLPMISECWKDGRLKRGGF